MCKYAFTTMCFYDVPAPWLWSVVWPLSVGDVGQQVCGEMAECYVYVILSRLRWTAKVVGCCGPRRAVKIARARSPAAIDSEFSYSVCLVCQAGGSAWVVTL